MATGYLGASCLGLGSLDGLEPLLGILREVLLEPLGPSSAGPADKGSLRRPPAGTVLLISLPAGEQNALANDKSDAAAINLQKVIFIMVFLVCEVSPSLCGDTSRRNNDHEER